MRYRKYCITSLRTTHDVLIERNFSPLHDEESPATVGLNTQVYHQNFIHGRRALHPRLQYNHETIGKGISA